MQNKKVSPLALTISSYHCIIEFLKGSENLVADLLSRVDDNMSQNNDQPLDDPDISSKTYEIGALNSNKFSPKEFARCKAAFPDKVVNKSYMSGLNMVEEQEKDDVILKLRQDSKKKNFPWPLLGNIFCWITSCYLSRVWILTQFCLFIPKHLQSDIISEYHSDLGHLGIEKTCSAIHSKYYWLNLHKDVTDYVIKCVTCQLRSSQQPKPPIQELDISPFAFAQLELGHCSGPYPTSLSGNRYIISFIDLYSGCIEAFACPDKSAQTIAQLLIEEIFQRFSRPLELFTDNGSENVNQVMKETLAAMIIPRVTGMVERSHHTLISIFSKKIATEGNSWDRWLGFSLAAMRFGVNESTQQSPFFLLYNGEVVLTIDNILKSRRKYQGEEPHKIALEQQHKNFLLVHQNRTKAQKKTK